MTLLQKITVMALLGAIGAVAGAVLGEVLFLDDDPARSEARKICLLFDVSGSMGDTVSSPGGGVSTQLQALQQAACDFVDRQDFALDAMALTIFSSDARLVTPLVHSPETLKQAIMTLRPMGGTDLGLGFDKALDAMKRETGERWVLLFSDGKPESSSTGQTPEQSALSAARRVREAGIDIVAIGTGLADASLLAQATGSADNVIISDPDKLADAFKRSEEVINRQMLASRSSSGSFKRNVVLTGCWAALIAIGASMGLVIAQNRHLRRRILSPKQAVLINVGGVVTGLFAGALGQTLFYVLSETPAVIAIGRVAAWSVLGFGIGFGMGSFVPNLSRERAALAGAIGGMAAASGFLVLVPLVGDTIGRLLGAGILGLCTGLTTVLVEAVTRSAWLVVHWSEKERSTVALGAKPVRVGSHADAHILLAEDDSPVPVMASITTEGKSIRLEDGQTSQTRELRDGEVLTYGRIRIEVRAATGFDAAAVESTVPAAPKKPKKAKKPKKKRPEPVGSGAPDRVPRAGARESNWYDTDSSSPRAGSARER